MNQKLFGIFEKASAGYSLDRLICDPRLRQVLPELVRELAEEGSWTEERFLHRLLNLRKAGKLPHRTTKSTRIAVAEFRFAAEIACRHLERQNGCSLDRQLCNPVAASAFDGLAAELAPGFEPLQYRWAALQLRKTRRLVPEPIGQALPASQLMRFRCSDLILDTIPKSPGLYHFFSQRESLYVGEAKSLFHRLKSHFRHSDNKWLARHMWDEGLELLWVEVHVLPSQVSGRARRAMELELIRSRLPRFNILGLSRDNQPVGPNEEKPA